MSILYVIPARAGSKGLPQKNIKLLCGKPLIAYTIEFALRNFKTGDVICVTTDDLKVISIAKSYGIEIPFVRPNELSSDCASSFEVIRHALDFYKNKGKVFEKILLLQPTSPIRIDYDFACMTKLYDNSDVDMVVSVKKAKENPYFSLFEEQETGFLKKIFSKTNYVTRQECPPVYSYNGSMYLVNVQQFELKNDFNFNRILKYEMPENRSVDIDTYADWVLAEYFLKHNDENS